MLEIKKADEYFALHLKRSEWETKSENDRAAALAMAEQDVSLELGGEAPDYANVLAVAAVCEQALFLLTGLNEALAPAAALLSSESIEGIGSRTYRAGINPATAAIAPRAQRFIEQLRGRPGAVKLNRG